MKRWERQRGADSECTCRRKVAGQRPHEPTLQEEEPESELVVCRNITETLLLAYV